MASEVAPLAPDDLWSALRLDLATALEGAVTSMTNDRHSEILARRRGVAGFDPHTLEEVARHFGLSRERVRQLEMKAYSGLRRALARNAAARSAVAAVCSIVGVGGPQWQDRVIQLAAVLLPRTPPTVSRRVVLVIVGKSFADAASKAIVDDSRYVKPRSASVSSQVPKGPVDDAEFSAQQEASEGDEVVGTSGSTVRDAVHDLFGVEPVGGPSRFTKRGWFHIGQVIVDCPACGLVLEGFRCPYTTSAGVRYHYWALVCLGCRRAFEPAELSVDARSGLYKSSELRPTATRPQPMTDGLAGDEDADGQRGLSQAGAVTPASTVDRRRRTLDRSPAGWQRWSAEEDELLREQHAAGWSVRAMSREHGRTVRAIEMRLEHLELA